MEEVKNGVMSVTETEPIIKKIVMVNNGRNGLKVTYHARERIDGLSNEMDASKNQKRPVHKDLRDGFKELRSHLLKMCGYYWPNEVVKDLLCGNTEVTYLLRTENGQFQLGGKRTVLDTHTIAINGPLLREDQYPQEEYDKLDVIMKNVLKETGLFMKGLKRADKKLITVDYLLVKKGVTNPEEAYASMSQEEIDEITKEALEESGLEIFEEDGQLVVELKEEVVAKVLEVEPVSEDIELGELDVPFAEKKEVKAEASDDIDFI